MTTIVAPEQLVSRSARTSNAVVDASRAEHVAQAVQATSRLVAPVWPLASFVAVNPFLGFADRAFDETAQRMPRIAGARLTMPRRFYAAAIDEGRIGDAHLAQALDDARRAALESSDARWDALPRDVASLRRAAREPEAPLGDALPTLADALGACTGTDWARIAVDRIASWAGSYWDAGQATWTSPWKSLTPFAAWRADASHDRTTEIYGVPGFRAAVRRLPDDWREAAVVAVDRLGVDDAMLAPYLARLAMSVRGWLAHARYHEWQRELRGGTSDAPAELLVVRLAWDAALLDAIERAGGDRASALRSAWDRARDVLASQRRDIESPSLATDLVLHAAYERGWEETLRERLAAAPTRADARATTRPALQAAFCIDVRSEVIRRALERQDAAIETLGFAGFFGFPIEHVSLGETHGDARCPVLLAPRVSVTECVAGSDDDATRAAHDRVVARRSARAWRAFAQGAISCFGFVSAVGLSYARALVVDSLGLARRVARERTRLAASLDADTRVAMAESLLRGMSLTDGFARVVLFVGHGATSRNNPHAASLACGACGGHSGDANARVAASVLNDPTVRAALAERGIVVPDDTVFVAALHDTTTDDVRLLDEHDVPASHARDLANVRAWFDAAGRAARDERAASLGIAADADVDASIRARSRDWAQVRPEWGLAGCAAFVVAPRDRTRDVYLGGRAFLHSYDWQRDDGFAVLEQIMTAPMIVASWISLQYYGSTVDNEAFGSGNKVLHNVVGALGVLEGSGGDLRAGLPWQSVHDGTRYAHEPVRLHVVIEAPRSAIEAVLAKHASVRALVAHRWLHLFAMDERGACERVLPSAR